MEMMTFLYYVYLVFVCSVTVGVVAVAAWYIYHS